MVDKIWGWTLFILGMMLALTILGVGLYGV